MAGTTYFVPEVAATFDTVKCVGNLINAKVDNRVVGIVSQESVQGILIRKGIRRFVVVMLKQDLFLYVIVTIFHDPLQFIVAWFSFSVRVLWLTSSSNSRHGLPKDWRQREKDRRRMDERMTLRTLLKEMMNGLFGVAGPDNPEIQEMMENFNVPKLHAGDGRMVGCWFRRGSWTAVSKSKVVVWLD